MSKTKKADTVAEYNACVDRAVEALKAVCREANPGAQLIFNAPKMAWGRSPIDKPVEFGDVRSPVTVTPNEIPMRLHDGWLFYRLQGIKEGS